MSPSTPETCPLTRRELEVVAAVGEGLTYQYAGNQLGCSRSTVRTHLQNAYRKLDVVTSAQAYLACVRAGWIEGNTDENPNDAAQMVRLERLLVTIGNAIRRRREKELTAIQRRYLEAFEEHLYAKGPAAVRVTADRLSVAFGALCAEAGISVARNVKQKLGAGPERKVA